MPTYSELQAQIAALTAQAEAARKAEVASVIAEIKEMMSNHSLSVEDLQMGSGRASTRKGATVAPKYRDGAGNTWTGRGKMPKWMQSAVDTGKSRDEFLIG